MRAVLAAVALVLACVPVMALAQPVELGLGRRLDRPHFHAPPPSAQDETSDPEGEEAWAGPQIQLGYSYWKLADAYGGGDVHSAAFEAFVHWPLPELRTGVLAEVGGRDYSLAGDDLVVRGAVELGFQLTRAVEPLVPHISALFSFGAVVGERFETTVAYGFAGGGLELGAALRIVRNFHLAASAAYLRFEMDGAAFDVFMFRVGAGL